MRVVLVTLGAVIMTAFAVHSLSFNEHKALYTRTALLNLDALSENLSHSLLPAMSNNPDIPSIATTLLQLDRLETILFAIVLDQQGTEVFRYVNQSHHSQSSEEIIPNTIMHSEYGTFLQEYIAISRKIIGEEQYKVGTLVVVTDLKPPMILANNLYGEKVIPLLIVLAGVISIFAYLMQNRVLLRLKKLTQHVANIREKQIELSKYTDSGDDEIGLLSKGINDFVERININNDKLERQYSQLEKRQRELEYLANYDVLTGLANRKLVQELLKNYLEKSSRDNSELVLLFMDLDDFKNVNDTLGHEVGDKLIVAVSNRLKMIVRKADVLARLGGDEFLIVLPDLESLEAVMAILARIKESFNKSFSLDEYEVSSSFSIGLATASNANYNPETLLRNADLAMYQAKRQGKGQYVFFEHALHLKVIRAQEIAMSIKGGLKNNELYLVYQPKVNGKGRIVGLEALVRWEHPNLGPLSPVEFIEAAERAGLVSHITEFVLKTAISDILTLKSMHNLSLSISINLSAHDVKDNLIRELIRSELTKSALNNNIEFEITETAYLEDFIDVETFMSELQSIGCSVALDDFGTGYSSLSYLTKLSIQTLKVDRQFIVNMEKSNKDMAVVQTIILLAKSLGLVVCAEGVETKEQFDMLERISCDIYQGYYFYKPKKLTELLAENVFSINELNKSKNV